jgi:hypothetical protein
VAGRFLATTATPDDSIIDPFNWAEFYARPALPPREPKNPQNYYVVLENNDSQHSRLPVLADAKLTAAFGSVVYHWPEDKPRESATVLVYRVTAEQMGK